MYFAFACRFPLLFAHLSEWHNLHKALACAHIRTSWNRLNMSVRISVQTCWRLTFCLAALWSQVLMAPSRLVKQSVIAMWTTYAHTQTSCEVHCHLRPVCLKTLHLLRLCSLLCLQAERNRSQRKQQFVSRTIFHPSFKNVSMPEAIALLAKEGETSRWLFRPSTKGTHQISITMKVNPPTPDSPTPRPLPHPRAFAVLVQAV